MPGPIPKRIIQTGKTVPQSLRTRAMVSNLRLLHPEYEYLFFDDAAVAKFLDEEFPQYRAVMDAFRFPIQRHDFFRYLAVYRYGGFYFDLDVLLASGLDGLLESGCVFSFEGLTFSHFLRNQLHMDWEIGNYGFGAAPGHPFLGAIIENVVRAQKDPAWVKPMLRGLPPLSKTEFYVLYTTGPGLVTRTFAENPDLAKTVTVMFPSRCLRLHAVEPLRRSGRAFYGRLLEAEEQCAGQARGALLGSLATGAADQGKPQAGKYQKS
jgi:hypothetical protein